MQLGLSLLSMQPFLLIEGKGKEWVRQKLSEVRDFITF